MSDDRVAGERAPAGQHLVQHAAERPDVGALVDAPARAPVPGSCSAAVPRIMPPSVAGDADRGAARARSAPARRLAPARSRGPSTVPVGRDLDVRRLRDRGARCLARARLRARRRSAARWRMRGLDVGRAAPRASRSASVSPSTSSRTSAAHASRFVDAVNGGDVRVIQRGEHARLALEAGEALRVGRERGRQDLDRDIAAELACRARDRPRPCRRRRSATPTRTEPRRVPASDPGRVDTGRPATPRPCRTAGCVQKALVPHARAPAALRLRARSTVSSPHVLAHVGAARSPGSARRAPRGRVDSTCASDGPRRHGVRRLQSRAAAMSFASRQSRFTVSVDTRSASAVSSTRQPAEESHLDHPALPLVDGGQAPLVRDRAPPG